MRDFLMDEKRNARYFLQPSGFKPEAENLENLPGKQDYYHNQAKGKSDAWVKQFLEAEWGYSVAGKPVVATFRSTEHVSPVPLMYQPNLPLVAGFDPGVNGSAFIFGQEDLEGRLVVLGEIVEEGYGVTRLIQEKLRPYLKRRFPHLFLENGGEFIIAPDPAAANRAQTDEKAVVDVLREHFKVSIERNNRLPLRTDAIDHYATRVVGDGIPGLLIDGTECPILVRALKGGWRWALDKNELTKGKEPEKNAYSHPGDAFGYLARYYHRQASRNERYLGSNGKPFVPPRTFGKRYHFA